MRLRVCRAVSTAAALGLLLSVLPAAADPPSPFTEEALTRGVDFTMAAWPQPRGYLGQGCGFVDLDADADPDIVIIGGPDGRIGIFENVGGGTFVDRTATSGIPVMEQHEGLSAADYDADGDLDLYITQANNRPNYLLNNGGNFTFTDVSAATGTNNGLANSTGSSWSDYNHDGWPDLYVSNYGQANALYRNNGAGPFSNLAFGLGLAAPTALSFMTLWTDYDLDGDVDLYLSNDREPQGFPPNYFWRNDAGVFTDVSTESNMGIGIFSMGLAAGDIDGNGYVDVYVTNIHALDSSGTSVQYDGYNWLMLNQGDGTFVEDSETWEVGNWITAWAAIFFDWDNDGYRDLYVVNQFEPNRLYDCQGAPPCTDQAPALGVAATYDPVYDIPNDDLPEYAGYNAAVADVDDDGDLDILVNILNHRAELFINQEGHKRNWVRYDVVGQSPHRYAIGAMVEATASGQSQRYETYAGANGYLGQNELIVHVGLGDATRVDQTVVRWPGGGPTRTLTDLPARQTWAIYPPERLCDYTGDGVDYADFVEFAGCVVAGFSPGCEMMDYDGDSSIWGNDAVDCYVTTPSDCNGNGTEDVAEIMLDLSLDGDQNYAIDCCEAGPATEPNAVGNGLLASKNASGHVLLSWSAPATDGGHAAADSYDVFRSTASAADGFGLLAQVATTAATDVETEIAEAYYLVGARNACGSSGEEPF